MYFHLYEVKGQNQLQLAVKMMRSTVARLNAGTIVQLARPRHIYDNSFFVAVGFESQHHEEQARTILSSIPGYAEHFLRYRSLSSNEVGEFLTGQLVDTEVVRIPQAELEEEDDPFNLETPVKPISTDTSRSSTFNFDQFHWYISAVGHGKWSTVLRIAASLGLAEKFEVRQIFRNMVLLGHVALSADGKSWTSLPPRILRRATKPERAFFAGQMVPAIDATLPQVAGLRKGNQPMALGPKRHSLDWDFINDNHEFIMEQGWKVCDDYRRIINALPSIDCWKSGLSRFSCSAFASWHAERWNAVDNRWESFGAITSDNLRKTGDGFYRLKFQGAVSIERFLYGDCSTGELIAGDWYGLRWLAGSGSDPGTNVAWHADDEGLASGMIIIPMLRRWPLLYERALVLASGKLPTYDVDGSRLIYKGIPKDMAHALAEAVGADLQIVEGPEANV